MPKKKVVRGKRGGGVKKSSNKNSSETVDNNETAGEVELTNISQEDPSLIGDAVEDLNDTDEALLADDTSSNVVTDTQSTGREEHLELADGTEAAQGDSDITVVLEGQHIEADDERQQNSEAKKSAEVNLDEVHNEAGITDIDIVGDTAVEESNVEPESISDEESNISGNDIDFCDVDKEVEMCEREEEDVQYIDEEAVEDQQISVAAESIPESGDALTQENISSDRKLESDAGAQAEKVETSLEVPQHEEVDTSKFEEISEGSIEQVEQEEVINEVLSDVEILGESKPIKSSETEKRNSVSHKGKTRVPFVEAESLEEVFFATENDDARITAEDKDNDDISDTSLSDHGDANLSLEEISDEDLEPSRKRRKSSGYTPVKNLNSSTGKSEDAKPTATESATDMKSDGRENVQSISHKRTASEALEDDENSKKRHKSSEDNNKGEQTSKKSDDEPAFFTGICGDKKKDEKPELSHSSSQQPKSEVQHSKTLSQVSRTEAQETKDRLLSSKDHLQRRRYELVTTSSQTEPRMLKGKIVQCNITPIKKATNGVTAGTEADMSMSKLLCKFKHQLPSSIPEQIFTNITSVETLPWENGYSFSMGPVTLSDMDSPQFREVAFRGAEKFSLVFDKQCRGILKASLAKHMDVASLVRQLKRLELGNRYMVMTVTYKCAETSTDKMWKAMVMFMYEQDIQMERQGLSSDGKVRAKLTLKGVPKEVSKDFIHLMFPEALSVGTAPGSDEERVVTLGFASSRMAEEICSCYDLVVINGSQVNISSMDSIQPSVDLPADVIEEAEYVIIGDSNSEEDKAETDAEVTTSATSQEEPVERKADNDVQNDLNSMKEHSETNETSEVESDKLVPHESSDLPMTESDQSEEIVDENAKDVSSDNQPAQSQDMAPVSCVDEENKSSNITDADTAAEKQNEAPEKESSSVEVEVSEGIEKDSVSTTVQKPSIEIQDSEQVAPSQSEPEENIIKTGESDSVLSGNGVENTSDAVAAEGTEDDKLTSPNTTEKVGDDKITSPEEVVDDKITSPVTTEGVGDDKITSPITTEEVGDDKITSPITTEEVGDDKITSPITTEEVGDDKITSPITTEEVVDDKITSPNTAEEVGDDKITSPNTTEEVGAKLKENDGEGVLVDEISQVVKRDNEQLEDVSDEETPNMSKQSDGDDVVVLREDPSKRVVANIDLTGEESIASEENSAEKKVTDKVKGKEDDKELADKKSSEAENKETEGNIILTDGGMEVSMEVIDMGEGDEKCERVLYARAWKGSQDSAKERRSVERNRYNYSSSYNTPAVASRDSYPKQYMADDAQRRPRNYPSRSSREGSPHRRAYTREETSERREPYKPRRSPSLSPRRDHSWQRELETYRHSKPLYAPDRHTNVDRGYSGREQWNRNYDRWQPSRYEDSSRTESYTRPPIEASSRPTEWQPRTTTYPTSSMRRGDQQSSSRPTSHYVYDHRDAPRYSDQRSYPMRRSRSRSQSLSDMSISDGPSSLRQQSAYKGRSPKRPVVHTSRSPISVSSRSRTLSPVSKSPSPSLGRGSEKELVNTVKQFLDLAKGLQQTQKKRHAHSKSPKLHSSRHSRSPRATRTYKQAPSPDSPPTRYVHVSRHRKSRSPYREQSRSPRPSWSKNSRSPVYTRNEKHKYERSPSPVRKVVIDKRKRHHEDSSYGEGRDGDKARPYLSRRSQKTYEDQNRSRSGQSQWPVQNVPDQYRNPGDQPWQQQQPYGGYQQQRQTTGYMATSSSNPYTYPPPQAPGYPPSSGYMQPQQQTMYSGGSMPMYQYGTSQYSYSNVQPSPYNMQAGPTPDMMTHTYQQAYSVVQANVSEPPPQTYAPSQTYAPPQETISSQSNTAGDSSSTAKGASSSKNQKSWSMGSNAMVFQRILGSDGYKKEKKSGVIEKVDRERVERPKQTKVERVLTKVTMHKR